MRESPFAILVENFVPRDCLVVAIRHVYLDESGTNAQDCLLTVAGYVFDPTQAARFSRDWSKVLDEHNLPYAHMADAVCGNGVYSHLSDAQCDNINRALIENIKRRTLFGFAVSVDRKAYEEEIAGHPLLPSCYSFCIGAALKNLSAWSVERNYTGRYAYFFESGHQHQSEANRMMSNMAAIGQNSQNEYSYFSHTFLAKADAPPLHAADMLAWHMTKNFKDKGKRPRRADFTALLRKGDWMSEYGADQIAKFKSGVLGAIQDGVNVVF